MAQPEGNPIESLGKKYAQKDAFQKIVRGVDDMQRRELPPQEQHDYVGRVFDAISAHVPQSYVPIYWLARTFPNFIPDALPYIQNGAATDEERRDAQKKIDRLEEIEFERTHAVEYAPSEDPIFEVSPQVERTIYNAIKYNDQGRDLLLVPMSDLPGIPGKIAVTVEQEGDSWGIALHLKSAEIDTKKKRDESNEFQDYTGLFYLAQADSLALQTLLEEVHSAPLLNTALGEIGFGKYPGGKTIQQRAITGAFTKLEETLPTVIGDEYEVSPFNEKRMVIKNDDGDIHSVSVETFERLSGSHTDTIIDGLSIRRFQDSKRPRLTGDYAQFQRDLQRELRFASGMVSWLYQYSRSDIDYNINIQSPDFGLLDWMEGNSLIEKISTSPNTLTDLGGNYDLRLSVEQDAEQFVHSYRGERGALKPQNTILFGETGIGKTALENGIAAKLIDANVPVFVLKGDLFAQTMLQDPQEGVKHLKQMFYYLLMHGGAIMVRDFDALLGSRDNPDANTIIEGVLLSELQRVKEDPSTWFVADTQFIGRISEALLNAHRIGKHREVLIETDQQGIEHIIAAVVRKVDKEINRRTTSLEFAQVQTAYPFDIPSLAAKIAEYGGMIPAQIERIVREEMQANATDGYQLQTDSLLARVDVYAEERSKMQDLRERQKADTLQATAAEAVKIAQAALQKVSELEAKLQALQENTGSEVTRVRRELGELRDEVGAKDASYTERFAALDEKLSDLEGRMKTGSIFSRRSRKPSDDRTGKK